MFDAEIVTLNFALTKVEDLGGIWVKLDLENFHQFFPCERLKISCLMQKLWN